MCIRDRGDLAESSGDDAVDAGGYIDGTGCRYLFVAAGCTVFLGDL